MILALAIIVAVIGLRVFMPQVSPSTTNIRLGEAEFTARIASSEADRQRGLSGTSELPEGRAMLFVYEQDGRPGIWMKDMSYPIDIVWLNSDKIVVDYKDNISPDTYPEFIFKPKEAARYVVELPSGTIEEASILVGQAAEFDIRQENS